MKPRNPNLQTMHLETRGMKLPDRLEYFRLSMEEMRHTYKRTVLTAADREVIVEDPFTGLHRYMLMFASNNYLGLANHPHVTKRVKDAMNEFGNGIGGPPLLNGYIRLIEELEERLAAFKGHEAAIIFSSGFMANLGLISALAEAGDTVLYDELSHASFHDGLKLSKARAIPFAHNDIKQLEELAERQSLETEGTMYVCMEGVYSMNGDIAPLNEITEICKATEAVLMIDDAHGTGVLGEGGRGTAFHLNCEKAIDINMGTFSKVFATCGGFVTASIALIEYLRYYARPYMFSASVPPPVAATVLGGLEVMENEPWLRTQLLANVEYAAKKLKPFGFYSMPQAGIITLALPPNMDIRKGAYLFHEKGIFLNPVEYPAVPANRQRFRISMMATHTKEDIDRLATAVEEVWNDSQAYSF
ncbi:MAG: pyridoxal phosphate-dependent aminotransferase family protein [Chitinophagaceae bacterium]|nr:pyridoxal phosphate-dependent aminotransferase family protein [Chitinophagaceae bacterium]